MDHIVQEMDDSATSNHPVTTQESETTIKHNQVTNSNGNLSKSKKSKIRVKIEKYNEAVLRAKSMK